MKFLVALLSLVAASATLPIYGKPHQLQDIKADSKMGSMLLSKARKLANNNNQEVDITWVAGYSIKFQGCHHVSQWNDEADGEEDVKIQTKRLIRFRLCPSDSCSATNAAGCNSGYGDYIIDMNTYLNAYFEATADYNEWKCQYLEANVCNCEDDDGKGDDFNKDYCLYDCFVAQGVETICADRNPYQQDGQQEQAWKLEEYMECGKWQAPNNNNNRELADAQVEYYMGPYCADQGGAIFMGLFTDDTCSNFADSEGGASTYYSLAGSTMPYAKESIVGMECVSCKEPEDVNQQQNNNQNQNNQNNDAQDADQVIDMCEQIYNMAGKCESSLSISSPNTNACTYMQGIKIVRKNGVVTVGSSKANKTASVSIGIFVVAFVLLAAYVYYLRTKLDRASINLSE